jgi:hypothetical protein
MKTRNLYTALGWGAACMTLVAYAQVLTAPPTVKQPIQPMTPSLNAAVTAPYMVNYSYQAPGQTPPSGSTTFPVVAYNITSAQSSPLQINRPATPFVSMTCRPASSGTYTFFKQLYAHPPASGALTLTVYKTGKATGQVVFTGALVTAVQWTSDAQGPVLQLQFRFTQATESALP